MMVIAVLLLLSEMRCCGSNDREGSGAVGTFA